VDPWLFLPFCPDDLEAVVAIESQSFAQPWKRRALEGELGSPGSLAFVLKPPGVAAQSDVAAYIFLRLLINEVHIMKLAVAPEHRRQGLATYLVGRALAEAHRAGGTRALLEVRPSNTAAIGLYTRLGFRKIGARQRYYGPAGEDALVMATNLKEIS
jgi:ribosomal-protein-alanine N-acetyltransferase